MRFSGQAKQKAAKQKAEAVERAGRHRQWAAAHPAKAREQRQLRKEQADLSKKYGHKRHGTPETHAHAARVVQGALARLYQSGAINADQLAWSVEIAQVHAQITADTSLRCCSLEMRVDRGRGQDGTFFEKLGAVRAEIAYSAWRARLKRPQPVLAMIIEDMGIAAAARRYGLHHRTARRLLIEALDQWGESYLAAARQVDARDLAAMQAGLC